MLKNTFFTPQALHFGLDLYTMDGFGGNESALEGIWSHNPYNDSWHDISTILSGY